MQGHQVRPGGPVSLQSLAPTLINTPEAANQGLTRYTWNFQAGVLRQVGANSAGHRPSRIKFDDPL